MNLLLDTHIFLWYVNGDIDKLTKQQLSAINTAGKVYLSAASVWELAIKTNVHISKGKVKDQDIVLNSPLESFIKNNCRKSKIAILNISTQHLYYVQELPLIHKDPFDRLIIAQGIITGYSIISSDSQFPAYKIKLI